MIGWFVYSSSCDWLVVCVLHPVIGWLCWQVPTEWLLDEEVGEWMSLYGNVLILTKKFSHAFFLSLVTLKVDIMSVQALYCGTRAREAERREQLLQDLFWLHEWRHQQLSSCCSNISKNVRAATVQCMTYAHKEWSVLIVFWKILFKGKENGKTIKKASIIYTLHYWFMCMYWLNSKDQCVTGPLWHEPSSLTLDELDSGRQNIYGATHESWRFVVDYELRCQFINYYDIL